MRVTKSGCLTVSAFFAAAALSACASSPDAAGGADASPAGDAAADVVAMDASSDAGPPDAVVDAAAPDVSGHDTGSDAMDSGTSDVSMDVVAPALVVTNATAPLSPGNPLSALVSFDTSAPATPVVTVEGGGKSWTVPPAGTLTEAGATHHEVAVLGLHADTSYTVTVSAGDGAAVSEPVALSVTTAPLPDDFPPIKVVLPGDPDDPGVTLIPISRAHGGLLVEPLWGYLVIVDSQGRVVFYHPTGGTNHVARRLANGNLLYGVLLTSLVEVDMLGREVLRYEASELGLDSIHHDAVELPSGNVALLSSELKTIDGYPGGNTYNVVGDVIVEVTRAGEVVSKQSLFDVLDPHRVHPGFDVAFWAFTYMGYTTPKDWTHANALTYDPTDDSFMLSVCYQDIVIRVGRQTGELQWVIGEDDPNTQGDDAWPFLVLDGPGFYPSQQHSAEPVGDGGVILYDNGVVRGQSRAVEYQLDPQSGKVTQVWEYSDPDFDPPLFARTIGDANLLPSGTVLVTDGAAEDQDADGAAFVWSHIVEVTHDAKKDKRFELHIRDDTPSAPYSYRVYRAERLSGLYP